MAGEDTKPKSRGLEGHIVTVLVSVMTLLLAWIGYQTQQTAVAVATLNVRIEGISANQGRLDRVEERLRELEREAWH